MTQNEARSEPFASAHTGHSAVQRIRMPRQDRPAGLYFKIDGKPADRKCVRREGIVLQKGQTLSLNTYFHSFYVNHYRDYTEIKDFAYHLALEGDFLVKIFRRNVFKKNRDCLRESLHEGLRSSAPAVFALQDLMEGYEPSRVYPEITCLSETGTFGGGTITTETLPAREIYPVFIICTFHREAQVRELVTEIFSDSDLKTEEFDLIIIDSAGTLKSGEFPEKNITLIPCDNYGGSGAFNRGIMEAVSRNKYSHVLLMDDDIKLDTETVWRALQISRFAKDDYVLAGEMLNINRMTHWFKTDLQNPAKLNSLMIDRPVDFCGFWFCVLPISRIKKTGLVAPYFIHVDDIEYGYRVRKKGGAIRVFPSVAVWHHVFEPEKVSPRTYYGVRNRLLLNAVYDKKPFLRMLRTAAWFYKKYVGKYSYDTALWIIDGFRDYLDGPEVFIDRHPLEIHEKMIQRGNAVPLLPGLYLFFYAFSTFVRAALSWRKVMRRWADAHERMTTVEFWEQYMGEKRGI